MVKLKLASSPSLAVLLAAAATAASFPPEASYDYSYWTAKLRNDVLAGYDRHTVPTMNRSAIGTDYSAAGTDVQIALRIFKVISVKAASGAMQLKVWLRLYWTDTRLAWNPADYGGVTYTHFWHA